jgi:hypothetical protein
LRSTRFHRGSEPIRYVPLRVIALKFYLNNCCTAAEIKSVSNSKKNRQCQLFQKPICLY